MSSLYMLESVDWKERGKVKSLKDALAWNRVREAEAARLYHQFVQEHELLPFCAKEVEKWEREYESSPMFYGGYD